MAVVTVIAPGVAATVPLKILVVNMALGTQTVLTATAILAMVAAIVPKIPERPVTITEPGMAVNAIVIRVMAVSIARFKILVTCIEFGSLIPVNPMVDSVNVIRYGGGMIVRKI